MAYELHLENLPKTLEFSFDGENAVLSYIDERLLPQELQVVHATSWKSVQDAIATLGIRGAPAIGVAGAAALALWAINDSLDESVPDSFLMMLDDVSQSLIQTRPTAVNLKWAVDQTRVYIEGLYKAHPSFPDLVLQLGKFISDMAEQDQVTNRAIGSFGAEIIPNHAHILTHCNAGSLATVYYGTALGVIYSAAAQGKVDHVYADETRPVGQGARLTAWELGRTGIPTTLICDNMAASLMAAGKIDCVIVGADRITADGSVANKIGTYGVAVLAHHHNIPFYVAAPASTFDFSLATGADIPIEQRNPAEVTNCVPDGVDVYNPAFDVTPAELVSAIITEKGVFKPSEISALKQ